MSAPKPWKTKTSKTLFFQIRSLFCVCLLKTGCSQLLPYRRNLLYQSSAAPFRLAFVILHNCWHLCSLKCMSNWCWQLCELRFEKIESWRVYSTRAWLNARVAGVIKDSLVSSWELQTSLAFTKRLNEGKLEKWNHIVIPKEVQISALNWREGTPIRSSFWTAWTAFASIAELTQALNLWMSKRVEANLWPPDSLRNWSWPKQCCIPRWRVGTEENSVCFLNIWFSRKYAKLSYRYT